MIKAIIEHIKVEHIAEDSSGAIYKRIITGIHPLWQVKIDGGWADVNDRRWKQLEMEYKSFERENKIIKSDSKP